MLKKLLREQLEFRFFWSSEPSEVFRSKTETLSHVWRFLYKRFLFLRDGTSKLIRQQNLSIMPTITSSAFYEYVSRRSLISTQQLGVLILIFIELLQQRVFILSFVIIICPSHTHSSGPQNPPSEALHLTPAKQPEWPLCPCELQSETAIEIFMFRSVWLNFWPPAIVDNRRIDAGFNWIIQCELRPL